MGSQRVRYDWVTKQVLLMSRKDPYFPQTHKSKPGDFSFLKILFIYLAVSNYSCGMQDLVSWQGIESGYPELGARSLSHWIIREVPRWPFLPFFLNISSKSVCIIYSLIHSFTPQIFTDTRSNAKNLLRPWTAARQASLSFIISSSLLKPMSNE